MPCCNPMKAFWTGQFTDTGKLDLVIMPGTSGNLLDVRLAAKKCATHRISPSAPLVRLDGHTYITDPLPIPCGRCSGCRMEKAKEWKVRFCDEIEGISPDRLHFVTLTYDRKHLPINEFGEPYLRKDDLDDFTMRLRRPSYGVNIQDLRFFACGEYGGLNHRPHFHLVMVYYLDDLVPYEWQCYHSATIDRLWRYRGIIQVKPVEPNMVAYVCGYCEKKQNDPYWFSYPVKPFTSKSKGLGFRAIDKLDGSPDRKVYGSYGGDCHSSAIPRAYLRKCEDKPWFQAFKETSRELGKKALKNNIGMYKTTDEEIMGFLLDASINEALEEKRILKI